MSKAPTPLGRRPIPRNCQRENTLRGQSRRGRLSRRRGGRRTNWLWEWSRRNRDAGYRGRWFRPGPATRLPLRFDRLGEFAHALFHFLAGLERYHVLRLNIDTSAGPRVPRLPRLPLLHFEHAEVPKFNPAFGHECLNDGVERPLHDFLRGELGQTALEQFFLIRLVAKLADDFFLGHEAVPPILIRFFPKWAYPSRELQLP
jgi:hypothetical protein